MLRSLVTDVFKFVFRGFWLLIWVNFWPVLGSKLFSYQYYELNLLVNRNKNIVIIFIPPSETDNPINTITNNKIGSFPSWKLYIDSFCKSLESNTAVYRMPFAEAHKFFQFDKVPRDERSMAFLKKGRPVLYSEYPVLSPNNFEFVKKYFQGKEDRKAAKDMGFSYIWVILDDALMLDNT